ncbi:MAG: GNAT family N-acetyltransferase [Pseudomonadota bacterium]
MLIIRPVEKKDHEDWHRLWTLYLEFYETTVTEEVYQTLWSRLHSGAPGEFRGLVAELDGKLIGLAHYLFHRHGWKVADVCYLQDLYVDAEVRGTGAGRALIEAVYAKADEAGAPSVYWLTQDFNAEARKLYDRIGTLTPFIRYNR